MGGGLGWDGVATPSQRSGQGGGEGGGGECTRGQTRNGGGADVGQWPNFQVNVIILGLGSVEESLTSYGAAERQKQRVIQIHIIQQGDSRKKENNSSKKQNYAPCVLPCPFAIPSPLAAFTMAATTEGLLRMLSVAKAALSPPW